MITSALDPVLSSFRHHPLVRYLSLFYAVVWIVCAFSPLYRFDWLLENLLIFITIPWLAFEFSRRPLSDVSYILIIAFLTLHTIGSHYTYAEVPVGFWLQEALSLSRNHYDRIVHFACGLLLAYPIRETFHRHSDMGPVLSGFVTFTVIAAASAVYEIIEMIVAALVSPDAAMAFLGVQGDVFDAQKDSALAIGGGLLTLMLTRRHFKNRV
ncbi:MAG: DUF2238 domain-containing protein [Rhodospirillales bacterium]|nr:DUF2238 domain-containing protein [Rhodospirillales bacterium]